jgi:O-methyltransferase involved in polyketide biosynthesis
VLEEAWLETVEAHGEHPCLFPAEGVFMYLEGAQVKSLGLRLIEHFPGVGLVLDAYSPFFLWSHNARVHRTNTFNGL